MPIVDLEMVFERLSAFPIRTFKEGDVVLSEGSRTGRLLFLIQGAVDVKDQWHVARVAEPGAVFGEMAALRSQPHGADVLAVQRSSFVVVDDAASCLKAEPLIALYVAVVQSGRLDAANRQLIAARSELAAKGERHRMCVAALDRIGGALRRAIPATTTSSISVTRPPAASQLREQAGDMTLRGPVAIMQLVEIAGLLQTSNAVCETIQEVSGAIGSAPHVSQVSYRFVVNRVLVPMINEAINCLYDGLAEPEVLDAMLALGAQPAVGPLALADRIGLDLVLDLLDTLCQATDDPRYQPSPLLRQLVDAGTLGLKTGQGFHKYNH